MSHFVAAPTRAKTFQKSHLVFLIITVFLMTLIYVRSFQNGFLTFDDQEFITENEHVQAGLTWSSIKWAFTNTDVTDWFPLTWLSILLDVQLFGLHAGAHHMMNALYHSINVLLFFFFLQKVTGSFWRSAFTALLFAVHPLRVESVVWAAERKDTLSLLFWMLTLFAYANYVKRKDQRSFWTAIGFYVCAAMSKPMVMTLPVALLLLDYWPFHRFKTQSFRALIIEKIPLGLIAIATAVIVFIPKYFGKHVFGFEEFPLGIRLANSVVNYVRYLDKTFFPRDLTAFYPYLRDPPAFTIVIGAILFLSSITFLTIRYARKFPYLLMGWAWFVVTLLPVIGIVRCTNFIIADRYTYIPHLGFLTAVVWGLAHFLSRWNVSKSVIAVGAISWLGALSWISWTQIPYWKDDVVFNKHSLEVSGENDQVHNNLALYYEKTGNYKEAAHHYAESLRLNPTSLDVMNNAANLLLQTGKVEEAAAWYSKILAKDSKHRNALINLGLTFIQEGRSTEAQAYLERALQLDPKAVKAYKGLADLAQRDGRYDKAWNYISAALALRPKDEEANYLAANIKVAEKAYPESKPYYETVLKKNPKHFKAAMNLANVNYMEGNLEDAIRHYQKALEAEPKFVLARVNLAKAYRKQGDLASARREYEEVLRVSPDHPEAYDLLEDIKKQIEINGASWKLGG